MSTVVTRSLAAKDTYDKAAVKVDSLTYLDKWGVITVTLTSYSWGSSSGSADAGTVDLRAPNYNSENDEKYVDNVALTNTMGSTSITRKAIFAVNDGVIGPAAKVNADGTWDLLHLTYEQPDDNDLDPIAVTLTYTVAFTDLTPVSNPSGTGTLTLTVDNIKTKDEAFVGTAASTLSAKNGYIKSTINSLTITAIDKPSDVVGAVAGDLVPMFTVKNYVTPGNSFASSKIMINHPTSKVSGVKTYDSQLFIIAVNNGKVDGNGLNQKSTNAQALSLDCVVEKLPEWPCDDYVTAAIGYAVAFTEIS